MFTGIVEETGEIITRQGNNDGFQFTIKPQQHHFASKIGESIAVNGVCLTVTSLTHEFFTVQVVPETLRKTNLGSLEKLSQVNLERSLLATTRIGGHFVQGHVDDVATIIKLEQDGEGQLVTFELAPRLCRYIVDKGFITIDGMSITVIKIIDNQVLVTLIPHTRQTTIAKNYKIGTGLNIETDMMAKYAEKFLGNYK